MWENEELDAIEARHYIIPRGCSAIGNILVGLQRGYMLGRPYSLLTGPYSRFHRRARPSEGGQQLVGNKGYQTFAPPP
jgi:hypothetical protein